MNQLEDNKNAGKVIGVIIGIAIIVMIICAANRSSHVSYASEDEMRSAVEGVWVYRTDYGGALWAVEINDDTLVWHYYSDDEGIKLPIQYHPSKGYITAGSSTKFIVREVEESVCLCEGEDVYKKGGLSQLERDPDSASYKEDLEKAKKEALNYMQMLVNKQSAVIKRITLIGNGTCEKNAYYFDCDVDHQNGLVRSGRITVYKLSSGEFQVQGLWYTD